ncbi:MAG: DUF4129 domain-containing protein [Syntrophales bacterium]|jgi:hypothetical protein|nr:DUF4129 domain-containing protein [Syntrophales bacterium]
MTVPGNVIPLFALLLIRGSAACAVLIFLRHHPQLSNLPVAWILALYPLSCLIDRLPVVRRRHVFFRHAIGLAAGIVGTLLLLKTQLYADFPWADLQWLEAAGKGFFSVFFGLTPEFATITASAACWIIGGRTGRGSVEFSTMVSSFQFGFVVFVLAVASAGQFGVDTRPALPLLPIFFISGLTGLAALRLREMSLLQGEVRSTWLFLLTGGFSLTLLLAGGIALLLHPDLLDQLLAAGIAAVQALGRAIGWFIELLARFLPSPEMGPLPGGTPVHGPKENPEAWVNWLHISDETRSVMRFFVALGWLSLLLVTAWRTCSQLLNWIGRRLALRSDILIEPTGGTFWADLSALFQGFLRYALSWTKALFLRRRRLFREAVKDPLSIARRIYLRMERWAGTAGLARNPDQTPHDFLRRLVEIYPDLRWEFTFITQQFARARYGPMLPPKEALDKMSMNWKKVHRYRLLKAGRKSKEA